MKKLLIINALIWAVVIMIASWLYNGSEEYVYLLGALAVGFTLQNGFTYNFFKRSVSK
ncbi:hypothetical protein [Christiangramia sabulilitoris]|uniref:hypothetical protein n=1 Tax=Christiangramia sabulilitoris TaxID=2583991 RepID=UPI001409878F|nr:hypothetical protein [Christiangramia sabulilitoris]